MDFPKMGHFQYFLEWETLIYGDDGIFMNWMVLFKWSISYLLLWILREGEELTNGRPVWAEADQSEACNGSSKVSRSSITLRSSPCSHQWARDWGFFVTICSNKKYQKSKGETISGTGTSGYNHFFCLLLYCFWNTFATYFALININLKLPLCANANFSLLLMLEQK